MPRPILVADDYIEEASPATPPAGSVRVYAKSDKKLYIKDSTGLETDLTATGTGASFSRSFFIA